MEDKRYSYPISFWCYAKEPGNERFGLAPEALRFSRDALRQYGNLSSAFVYFVLNAALAEGAPGGWWWMSSFGAGFTCHGALLAVE